MWQCPSYLNLTDPITKPNGWYRPPAPSMLIDAVRSLDGTDVSLGTALEVLCETAGEFMDNKNNPNAEFGIMVLDNGRKIWSTWIRGTPPDDSVYIGGATVLVWEQEPIDEDTV